MSEIIKTWPGFMNARKVSEIFSPSAPAFARYYFTLGRGKPSQSITKLWFTWRGRVLGFFFVEAVVINDGTLPKLHSLSGETSEWQIKPDRWVAICRPPCNRIKQRVYMTGFRGWRYFNFKEYAESGESKVRI